MAISQSQPKKVQKQFCKSDTGQTGSRDGQSNLQPQVNRWQPCIFVWCICWQDDNASGLIMPCVDICSNGHHHYTLPCPLAAPPEFHSGKVILCNPFLTMAFAQTDLGAL